LGVRVRVPIANCLPVECPQRGLVLPWREQRYSPRAWRSPSWSNALWT